MSACPFEDPDLLYDAYKEQVMLDGFNEDSSTKLLAWCLQRDAEKHNFKDNISIPTYRELFTTAVWPLVNDLQFGRPVPRQLGEIGLDSRLSLEELHTRLSYLLSQIYGEYLSTNLWKKLNAALVDWVTIRRYKAPFPLLPLRSFYTERLIGWEALLLWHYCTTTQVGRPGRIPFHDLRSQIFEMLRTQWQHSKAGYKKKPIREIFRSAAFFTKQMMDILQHDPISWLAVFSKCIHANQNKAELADTSDPEKRNFTLAYLELDRKNYLKEPTAIRVREGISTFSAFAMTLGAQLGGSTRGRHQSDPEAARAATAAKLCMWGCPYRDTVQKSIPNSLRRRNNPSFELLLTALLLYPLSADAATVHRWLKHLDEGFDQEALGGMRVVEWHNQLGQGRVAVFRDIVQEVPVRTKEEWIDFWETNPSLTRKSS